MKNRDLKYAWMIFAFLAIAAELVFMYIAAQLTLSIVLSIAGLAAVGFGIFSIINYIPSLYKICSITVVCLIIGIALYLLLLYTGFLETVSDPEKFKAMISKTGGWAEIVFVLISFAQVTLVPIPSTITVMAGGMMFGLWKSVLLSLIGIIGGSMVAFSIGKVFGVKLVKWIAGEAMIGTYANIAEGRDVVLLFFMFILPMFPDDILCLIAGLTSLSYTKFFIMQLVTRPIGTIGVAAIGDGALNIPFKGSGIFIWLAIGLTIFGIMFCVWKYNTRVLRWLKDKAAKRKRLKYGYGNIIEQRIDERIKGLVSNAEIVRVNDYFYNEPKYIVKELRKHDAMQKKLNKNHKK